MPAPIAAGVITFLTGLWASWKAWRARKAAAELPYGEKVIQAMRKDAEEIERLNQGIEKG